MTESENIVKQYMIKQVQKMAVKLNKTPTYKDMRHIMTNKDITDNFGTYNNILKAAGLPINKRGKNE